MTKQFVSSYAGESDYLVNGRKYRIRYFAIPTMSYADGVFAREILPAVGTVRAYDSGGFYQFPPDDVVALFPGFIGARYAQDWTMEYNGPAPIQQVQPWGWIGFVQLDKVLPELVYDAIAAIRS
jgi:hypothetical protein